MFRFPSSMLTVAALLAVVPAEAAEVSPLLIEFEAAQGPSSNEAIRVRSTEAEPKALEIRIYERLFDEAGRQQLESRDDEFLVFPAQAVLAPESTQVFRFQYLGDVPSASRNFYFNVRQIPISLNQDASRVDVIVEFAASVNLLPQEGKAEVGIVSATESLSDEGVRELVFVAQNSGNRHLYLSSREIEVLKPDGTTETLDGQAMKTRIGDTLVPALGKREFRLPLEESAPRGEWRVRIKE